MNRLPDIENVHEIFFDKDEVIGRITNTLINDMKFIRGYKGEIISNEIKQIEKKLESVVAAIEIIINFKQNFIIGSDAGYLETPENKIKFEFYNKIIGNLLSKIHDNKIKILFGYLKALVPKTEGNGNGQSEYSEKINILTVSR